MDKNYIIELLKANRLQEAIKAIEKASEGSHLHNQVIMLSSSYAEYVQLNRSATQDFQTLEMQRAKITNSLLSFLDELAPEAFDKADVPQTRRTYSPPAPTTGGIDKKWYYMGGGALLLLLILIFSPKGNDTSVAQTNELNGYTVKTVSYQADGHFIKDGESWIQTQGGETSRYVVNETETCCVHLRDNMGGLNVVLDLTLGRITWQNDNGTNSFMPIIGVE